MVFDQKLLHKLKMKSGDIVLFSGEDWVSILIRVVTNSKWSHVGIIVDHEKELYLFEAQGPFNSLNPKRALAGKVKINPLDKALNVYKGTIAVRHLHKPLTKPQKQSLNDIVLDYLGVSYEEHITELLKSAIDLPKWWQKIPLIGTLLTTLTKNKENNTSLFCSELAALTYRNLGFNIGKLAVNEFTPEDLSSTSDYKPFKGYRTFSKERIFVDKSDVF